ncbi:hypothetical protein DFH07DRAFT_834627 [Mycena maculata]|uniref:DUF7719 domain-containing protein n=1 Tax=Mycena maculata TaxID=230809 RepID=A0AAD7IJE5_9AGAR|nr:hypothetical protein DFH07DRAFT_834627 [Mycena maculata]
MPRRAAAVSKPSKPINIPQEEQRRLINESGVLKKVDSPPDSDDELPLGEEIFNATLLITPCTFLLLLMQILIFQQYGQDPNLKVLVDKLISGVPILYIFVFYTSRHKRDRRMQHFLFLLGTAAGCRMLFLIKRGSYLVNMQQIPSLVTVWVYIVIQLDLGLAFLNLVLVGLFVWWKGLDLFK